MGSLPKNYYDKDKVEARLARKAEADLAAFQNSVKRDPCVGCQVPHDRHDDHGCRQYIPRRH